MVKTKLTVEDVFARCDNRAAGPAGNNTQGVTPAKYYTKAGAIPG